MIIKMVTAFTWVKKTLLVLHSKTVILNSILISLLNAVNKHFFEKWFITDWQFAIWLSILVMVDTILGMIAAWKDQKISSEKFSNIFIKIIVYTLLLICINTLTNFTIAGKHPQVFDMADDVLYSGLVFREFLSVTENVSKIHPNIIPKWIKKRLEQINEEGPK